MQPVAVIKHSNILQYILLRRTAGLVVLPLALFLFKKLSGKAISIRIKYFLITN
jgi:hypothetical protein